MTIAEKPYTIYMPQLTDNRGRNKLLVAIANNDYDLAQHLIVHYPELINEPSDLVLYPIFFAIDHRRYDILELLLTHGANPNVINWDDMTPLRRAVMRNDTKVAKILLKHGATIAEASGKLPLLTVCVSNRNAELTREVLNAGADPFAASQNQSPALFLAIHHGFSDIARILVEHQPDLLSDTRTWYGQSLTHIIVDFNLPLLMEFYSCSGKLNVNIPNEHGDTPLHCAITNRNMYAVQQLLLCGANVIATNRQGITAIGLAKTISPEMYTLVSDFI